MENLGEILDKQMKTIKPPIGLTPVDVHNDARMKDIFAAMYRYTDAKRIIPEIWITELRQLALK